MQRLLCVVAGWLLFTHRGGWGVNAMLGWGRPFSCWTTSCTAVDIMLVGVICIIGIRYAHHLPILLATTSERERVSAHGGGWSGGGNKCNIPTWWDRQMERFSRRLIGVGLMSCELWSDWCCCGCYSWLSKDTLWWRGWWWWRLSVIPWDSVIRAFLALLHLEIEVGFGWSV